MESLKSVHEEDRAAIEEKELQTYKEEAARLCLVIEAEQETLKWALELGYNHRLDKQPEVLRGTLTTLQVVEKLPAPVIEAKHRAMMSTAEETECGCQRLEDKYQLKSLSIPRFVAARSVLQSLAGCFLAMACACLTPTAIKPK